MMESERLASDIISTLPQSIIETILCLIPTKEAARTSILSRDWRYKWTTIPKLVFDHSTVSNRTRSEETLKRVRHELLYDIHKVLLMRQGPIHEFTLSVIADEDFYEIIDQIILYLSRNHNIKKLTLDLYMYYKLYKLPLYAFSLHQLTDLRLECVDLDHPSLFVNGYASFKSLHLIDVKISTKSLLHLLSNCPSLTSFNLRSKLEPDEDCTVMELFECLPVIERLTFCVPDIFPWLVIDTVPKELPTLLVHLKYLELRCIFVVDDELRFLAVLLKCSPNLEIIKLDFCYGENSDDEVISGISEISEEYSDVRLEHLIELEIDRDRYSHLEHGFEIVKFIFGKVTEAEESIYQV